MKSRDFAFWLQGFFEMGGGETGLNATQAAIIKQHLGLVFQHDPDIAAKPHAPVMGGVGTSPLPGILIC
jgi:hypothetical protein